LWSNIDMRTLATLLITGMCASPSLAGEVFTWTDDEGVVHFSQWAPQHTAVVTTLNTVSRNPVDYDPGADPYSIQNQAVRVNETWSKVEERNAELRKRREEEEERAARMRPPAYEYPYYPYYQDSYYRPIVRPIVRPPIYRPVHPIYPGHNRPHVRKVQNRQVAAMNELNRRPNQRVPYSPVTGVSQRATIYHRPQD
jgi:hypothetical protein